MLGHGQFRHVLLGDAFVDQCRLFDGYGVCWEGTGSACMTVTFPPWVSHQWLLGKNQPKGCLISLLFNWSGISNAIVYHSK